MRYVTEGQVKLYNRIALQLVPLQEIDFLRDAGALDMCINKPKATAFGEEVYVGIHNKAAVLMEAIIMKHPFENGNKRTALLTINEFYRINGHTLSLSTNESLELLVKIAKAEISLEEIATFLAKRVTATTLRKI